MKKSIALVLSFMVLFCASCNQQVVSNDVPGGGSYGTTASDTQSQDGGTDTETAEDIADITEEDSEETAPASTTSTVQLSTDEEISEEDYSDYEDEEEEEEYEEPEYDYDPVAVAEKAKSLNKTADSIRNEIDSFLLKAALSGYGMTAGGEGTFLCIYIDEGVWTVMLDDTECFVYNEEMEWFGYGEADSTTEKADAEDPDTLLALAFATKFPDIKNGSAGAWIEGGSCKAAYFTEDTTAGDGQMDYLLGEGGWLEKYCEWDGYNQGMSDEGNIVGTSPVLEFAVEE